MDVTMEQLNRLTALLAKIGSSYRGCRFPHLGPVRIALTGEAVGPDALSLAQDVLDEIQGTIEGLGSGLSKQAASIAEAHEIIRGLRTRLSEPPGASLSR